MAEGIELSSYWSSNTNGEEIEQYDEIKLDDLIEETVTTFTPKDSSDAVHEFDFFNKQNVKRIDTKKKVKTKVKKHNLMDIISSELATNIVPLKENVITLISSNRRKLRCHLENTRTKIVIPLKCNDTELGWGHKSSIIHISPIFPRILENIATKDIFYSVGYVKPCLFEDIVKKNIGSDKNSDITFLDVTLRDARFKDHYSFSLEKLLTLKLEESYNEYEHMNRLLNDICDDIIINRETKNNLKKEFYNANPSKKENIRFDPTIRKYTQKMLQSKEKYRQVTKALKEVTQYITSLWLDIEIIRRTQGHMKTNHVLKIINTHLDDKEIHMKWDELFNLEYTDILDKIEFDYVSEYMEYKKVKNHSKQENNIIKPKLIIDESEIKKQVEYLVKDILVKDRIDFILEINKGDLNNLHKSKELSELFVTSFHFEIYMDNIFICESEHYSCDDTFSVNFIESFSIQILPHNNTMEIFMLENGKKVSNIAINLSHIKKNYSNSDFTKEFFIYKDKISPDGKMIGNGFNIKEVASRNRVRLKSSNYFKEILQTSCEVEIKVGWNDKLTQNQNVTVESSMEVARKLKKLLHGLEKLDSDSILDILSTIYDQDVKDLHLIQSVRSMCIMVMKTNNTAHIDISDADLIRLKLLHLRSTGNFSNMQNKTVPLYGSQITTEQLDCLQKTEEKAIDMEYLNVREAEMDPIELQRFIGAKYVQKLNKNMLKNLNDYLLKKTHKDVVINSSFSWRNVFAGHTSSSKVRTTSMQTKLQMLKECLNKEQQIQITVLRAFNLMDRTTIFLEDDDKMENCDKIAGFKVRELRPFVRVSYKGITAQTVTAIGCHPTWSHTLKINTILEPLSCLHINIYDEYKANINEGYSEDEQSNKTVHYRYYHKWLGRLQVPLSTVLSTGVLRGTFKIAMPPLIFGYESLRIKEPPSVVPEILQLMKKDTAFITLEITTNLSYLSGSHAYSQPLPSSMEDDYLIKHLNNFVTEYINEFPSRNISLTFIDSVGRNKCVTQFLQPIPLPERDFLPINPRGESAVSKSSGRSSSSSGRRKELDYDRVSQDDRESLYSNFDVDNLKKMMNACMRYVSLIPCYEVNDSHAVTLLGTELLKVLHGSPLDHTILLASYFIYLGIKCWVAIGFGLPRGKSSYVLIKYDLTIRRIVQESDQAFRNKGLLNKNDGYTWYVCDAVSGERFELRDVGCPLKTVDYVFDNENIWVNIQNSVECEHLSFDFSKSSDWQPVFDKSVFVMKQPVVKDSALYCPPPSVESLRVVLENKLKSKVQKWRSHMKTIWNRYSSGLLRDTLSHWEAWTFNPGSAKPGFTQKLKQLMLTYKIFGFPLNMGYVNTKAVTAAVKATGLHATDDPNAEFALAVEVYSYPNNVVSVWVFLASITRL